MSAPDNVSPPSNRSLDWMEIFKGGAEGTRSSLEGAAKFASSRKEAKEARRRTLANLKNKAAKRSHAAFRSGQDYNEDAADLKSQSIQQMARDFVNALKR